MLPIRNLAPRGKKLLLANLLEFSGVNRLMARLPGWSGLLVLNYHRIGCPDETPFDRNLFSATQEKLEQQIRAFQHHGEIVGIEQLPDVLTRPRGKYLLITFDDGYRDNYELAFPVLRACGARATFFIATGFIDQPRVAWWDEIAWMLRQHRVKKLPRGNWFSEDIPVRGAYPAEAIGAAVRKYWSLPAEEAERYLEDLALLTEAGRCPKTMAETLWMTWDMIRELATAGHDIGGHTVDHPVLAQCSLARQQWEIEESRRRLTAQLGAAPQAFSYPVGQPHMFTEPTQRLLEAAGYRWGFSFYGNYCRLRTGNPYDLPRCAIDFDQPASLFRARLTCPQIFSRK
ncbi:MAG: polysaccharide deacetylase family protein [Planctomycetaceae bacterium]|nr:polysaccharide deacetylase family protein [Planctomycetaceae bacterium]